METHDLPASDAEFEAIEKDFQDNLIETISDNWDITYIIKDSADLEKYSKYAEIILNAYWEPEVDFICTVTHADRKNPISFNCKFDAKHLLLDEEFEDDEPTTAFDELEEFKRLWPDYFLEKLNSEEDIEYPISYDVDLVEMGKLILEYVKDSNKIDIPITIVLINLKREKEILHITTNV